MLSNHYQAQRDGLIAMVRSSGATGEEPVPACPGWTVADVIRHLLGLTDNWLTADLEIYASPEWTSRQVEAWSSAPLDELFAEWTERGDRFAAMLDDLAAVETLPEVVTTVIGPVPTKTFGGGILGDLTQHCYDVASALEAEMPDPLATIPMQTRRLTGRVHLQWKPAGHEPVRIVSEEEGELGVIGGKEADVTLTAPTIDLFRSMGGRRTAEQIQALDWNPTPPPVAALSDFVIRFFTLPTEQVESANVQQ